MTRADGSNSTLMRAVTTRRRFLSTAVGIAAGSTALALANPVLAAANDPVFAAIEVHKAARLAFENAVSRGSALEQELPREKTRSWITGLGRRDCGNRRSAMDRQRA